MADKFIKGAIKRPGALTAKAKAAGKSVASYAQSESGAKGVGGDEARFYMNVLRKVRPGSRHQPKDEKESAAAAKSKGPESKETPAKKRADARPMSRRAPVPTSGG